MKRETAITVGAHRGNSRIWLQGKWLVEFGFTRGKFWRVEYNSHVTITTADSGRKISGKGDTPVLDMNSAKLSAIFQPGQSVLVTATPNKITITKAK